MSRKFNLNNQSHFLILTLEALNPQNGQTYSNNLPAVAEEMFECVWPFCEVDA